MNLKTLTGQVEYILSTNEESRNSDITLTIEIWKRFYPQHIKTLPDVMCTAVVSLKSLFDLPREDNVKRIRAAFQNDALKYLPTDWRIAEARGINEQEWRAHLDNPRTLHSV